VGSASFTYTGALDPADPTYIERPEDHAVRQALARVGTECVLISLIGARQTGKTSLLNRLHAEYRTDNSGWTVIKLDISLLIEVEGDEWYRQFIVLCCERLQRHQIGISIQDLEIHNLLASISPFSARGWSELLHLACQRLSVGQRLLISLDEISSVPRQQWDPFFSNIRALNQAASSPDDRPEYRKLGIILAGAFVPAQLINIVEKSPFNVSTKIYMAPTSAEHVQPLFQLLADQGYILEDAAKEALYEWSGGLLYHVQRFCTELLSTEITLINESVIEMVAETITFDDTYLSHILRQLEQNQHLLSYTRRIMAKPLRSSRNFDTIATLEITGVIRYDPVTKEWRIVNRLCERFLRQYFAMEEQPMTGLEPIAAAALTKAVDFLFDQAGKLMEERRELRKQRGDDDDTPSLPNATVTTKEEVQSWQVKTIHLKDIPEEVKHCRDMIHLYRRNKRAVEDQIGHFGGFTLTPTNVKNELRMNEDNIKFWCQKLKDLIEQAYGHQITIIGFA
jgi:AAA-like domain